MREVPRPEPRQGWALVRVEAFGLNRSEYMTLRGWSGRRGRLPAHPRHRVRRSRGRGRRRLRGRGRHHGGGGHGRHGPRLRRRLCGVRAPARNASSWRSRRASHGMSSGHCRRRSSPPPARSRRSLLARGRRCWCAAARRPSGSPASSSRVPRACASSRRHATRTSCPPCAQRGADAWAIEGPGFVARAREALPESAVDGVVDLIGGRAVLDSLALVRRGGTVCNSGMLGAEWVIDDFEPIDDIPSGRKLTAYHSSEAADASIGGPLLRAVVEQVERGAVDPGHRHRVLARRDRRRPSPHGGGRRDRQARGRPADAGDPPA